jgi:hypothetical protein
MYDKLESIENSITKLQSLIENRCAQIPAPELEMQGVQGMQGVQEEQREKALELMPQGLLKKRPGPKLWNEFLKNYMRMQEAKGRKISRGQAMKEAGPNYRAKHDRPTPKTRKKVKNFTPAAPMPMPPVAPIPPMPANKNIAPIPPMPANQPPVARNTPTPPQVNLANVAKPITPGSLVTLAPGRGTPVNAPSAFQNILNTLTSSPRPNKKTTPVPTPVPTPAPQPNQPTPSNTNLAAPSNNQSIPSPATYGYEDLGMAANNSARKVLISGEEYYMTDSDRALFQRMGDDLGEWVGYLEPGGVIRYTEQPNA